MSGDCFLIERMKFSYSTLIPTVSMEAAEHVRGAAKIFMTAKCPHSFGKKNSLF